MVANTIPVFSDTPSVTNILISTANTNRDGTGTIGTAFTPAADGSLLRCLKIKAEGTSTAGMLRVFVSYDGTNWRLLDEILVDAITPSALVKSFEYTWFPPGYQDGAPLQSGRKIGISTHNAENFSVTAFGEDL